MELVTGLGIFIVSVLTAALSRTIVNEFVAWSPWVIRGFIKLAVAQLPNKQRERFDEEWGPAGTAAASRTGRRG